MRATTKATLLRLHFSESDRHQGKALHEAVVDRAKQLGIAGAPVFRGLEGYGGNAEVHRTHLMHRDQPIVVSIVDTTANIARFIPEIQAMIDTGLIATSEVDSIRMERGPGSA